MPQPSKFDHDEARARYAAGESGTALAREYGVSGTAVYRVVNPQFRARMDRRTREAYLGVCEECRGPCLSVTHAAKKKHAAADGRQLCHECRSKARRERVLVDGGILVSVRCVTCKRWFDPDMFPRGTTFRDLRPGGIHIQCRDCQTAARQDYRERHKVPCARCGQPCLPPSEKGPRRGDTGLCLTCYRASIRKTVAAVATPTNPKEAC